MIYSMKDAIIKEEFIDTILKCTQKVTSNSLNKFLFSDFHFNI